jgi:hypothetical protein
MSDTADTPTPSAADGSLPPAAPPPVASSPPADAAGGDPFAELPADQPLFPRSYVEKLRNEGHKYRTEAQSTAQKYAEYDKVYGIYDDQDRQVWMDLARTWAVDPNRAAEAMQAIARSVLGEPEMASSRPAEPEAETSEDGNVDMSQLTPEQVQQMISDALTADRQTAAEQRAVEDIYSEVRSLGYDPDTREGFMVLWTANNETDGDLNAAVERIKQYRQGIIDEYVAGRSGQHPQPAPTNGVSANQQVEITSFDEARKATEAFLRGQRVAGP